MFLFVSQIEWRVEEREREREREGQLNPPKKAFMSWLSSTKYSTKKKKKKNLILMTTQPVTYVVEHLDPELGPWSALEYGCIAKETNAIGARFLLSSVPLSLQMPNDLDEMKELEVDHHSIEETFASQKSKICLLDPAAEVDLSPDDGNHFDIFLFGGILGDDPPRGTCLYDFMD